MTGMLSLEQLKKEVKDGNIDTVLACQDDMEVLDAAQDGHRALELVQETFDGTDALRGFAGGNEIVVSPDGHNVYAAGSRSRNEE